MNPQHGTAWSNGPMVQFSGVRAQQVFGTLWCHWPLYPGKLTVNHSDSENSPQAKPQLSCLRTIPVARMICWNTKLVAASLISEEEWDRRKVQQHHLYNILSSLFFRYHLCIMIQKMERRYGKVMSVLAWFPTTCSKSFWEHAKMIPRLPSFKTQSIIHDTLIYCLTMSYLYQPALYHSCSPSPPSLRRCLFPCS